MNHTVFQIDPADSRFTDTFARFFTDCGEYELFSDCDTPYFAVFSDIDRTHCTGRHTTKSKHSTRIVCLPGFFRIF